MSESSTGTRIPVPNELGQLYAEKGELVTQLEVAQGKLQQINLRIAQILGLNQPGPKVQ